MVDEIESTECPVSAITLESKWILGLEAASKRVHSGTGAAMFGPDSRRYPAWWYDAVTVIENCRVLENNARIEAETEDMRRR